MKDMADSFALRPGQSFTKQQAIGWFAQHYPKIRPGTVHCHLIRLSTNAPTRLHYNAKPHEDDIFFQLDGGHFRLYDPAHDPAPIHEKTDKHDELPPTEEDAEPEGSAEFAYEADLRNYLAKNLSIIETGLRLYQDEGVTGVEFPVGGRFIDILAVDAKGAFVVIELKVSRGVRPRGRPVDALHGLDSEESGGTGPGSARGNRRPRDQRGPVAGLLVTPWRPTL
jgi:hypothetical protein